jgi:hypothetical protein
MPNRNTDIEKAKKLSRIFKRNNLIRMVKQYSIDNQLYELAAYARDIERDIEKQHEELSELPYPYNEMSIDEVYSRLEEVYDKIGKTSSPKTNNEAKYFLKSLLRDYKIDTILKNPLD